jgi:hypothetical protein
MENGAFYEGQFQNDLFSSRGYLQTRDFKYEGGFKNGEFDGLGIKTDFNRLQAHEGEWQAGKRNGNINFYQMKLESSSNWKDDKKLEISEVVVSSEFTGPALTLNYANIQKTPNEFKDFFQNILKRSKEENVAGSFYDATNKNLNDSPNKPNISAQMTPGAAASNLNLNVKIKEEVKSGEKVMQEEVLKREQDFPMEKSAVAQEKIRKDKDLEEKEREEKQQEGDQQSPPQEKQCFIF